MDNQTNCPDKQMSPEGTKNNFYDLREYTLFAYVIEVV